MVTGVADPSITVSRARDGVNAPQDPRETYLAVRSGNHDIGHRHRAMESRWTLNPRSSKQRRVEPAASELHEGS